MAVDDSKTKKPMSLDAVFTLWSVLEPFRVELQQSPLHVINAIQTSQPKIIISIICLFYGESREEAMVRLSLADDGLNFILQIFSHPEFKEALRLAYAMGKLNG